MSCVKCGEIQDKRLTAYFRIGKANVGIIGCDEHTTFVMEAIQEKQAKGDTPGKARQIVRVFEDKLI